MPLVGLGTWKAKPGEVGGVAVRLAPAWYFEEMLRPARPGVFDSFGFLTWLNRAAAPGRRNGSVSERT